MAIIERRWRQKFLAPALPCHALQKKCLFMRPVLWTGHTQANKRCGLAATLKRALNRRNEIFFKSISGVKKVQNPNNLICLKKARTTG
ncbi:hypothetical protein [Pseudomonas ovata]|uniref:hypothetical protein n=1 Tax=Pseudomonas ovata TaxID=1839709 RepID=UPI00126010EB|nr:hypothetical protein [Pseudomonas ovata]